MSKRFEIIYDDASVVSGSTAAEFRDAPDDGIQFVVTREGGYYNWMKALDEYEYEGEVKRGSWTTRENYEDLKAQFNKLSKLIYEPESDEEFRRMRNIPGWLDHNNRRDKL